MKVPNRCIGSEELVRSKSNDPIEEQWRLSSPVADPYPVLATTLLLHCALAYARELVAQFFVLHLGAELLSQNPQKGTIRVRVMNPEYNFAEVKLRLFAPSQEKNGTMTAVAFLPLGHVTIHVFTAIYREAQEFFLKWITPHSNGEDRNAGRGIAAPPDPQPDLSLMQSDQSTHVGDCSKTERSSGITCSTTQPLSEIRCIARNSSTMHTDTLSPGSRPRAASNDVSAVCKDRRVVNLTESTFGRSLPSALPSDLDMSLTPQLDPVDCELPDSDAWQTLIDNTEPSSTQEITAFSAIVLQYDDNDASGFHPLADVLAENVEFVQGVLRSDSYYIMTNLVQHLGQKDSYCAAALLPLCDITTICHSGDTRRSTVLARVIFEITHTLSTADGLGDARKTLVIQIQRALDNAPVTEEGRRLLSAVMSTLEN